MTNMVRCSHRTFLYEELKNMKHKLLALAVLCSFCDTVVAITTEAAAKQLMQAFNKIKQGASTQSEVQQAVKDAQSVGISLDSYAKKAGISMDEVKAALRGEGPSEPRRREEPREEPRREEPRVEPRREEPRREEPREEPRNDDEEQRRRQAAQEAQRRAQEEQRKQQEEAEKRQEQQKRDEARKKLEKQEEDRKKKEEADKKKREDEEKSKADEAKKKQEDEKKRKEEEDKKKQEGGNAQQLEAAINAEIDKMNKGELQSDAELKKLVAEYKKLDKQDADLVNTLDGLGYW